MPLYEKFQLGLKYNTFQKIENLEGLNERTKKVNERRLNRKPDVYLSRPFRVVKSI